MGDVDLGPIPYDVAEALIEALRDLRSVRSVVGGEMSPELCQCMALLEIRLYQARRAA